MAAASGQNVISKGMKMGVIGAGKMAEAIIHGMLSNKLLPASNITIADPNPERRDVFKSMNTNVTSSNIEAVTNTDVVLMAIKPQNLNSVLNDLENKFTPDSLILSIIAGTPIDAFQAPLGSGCRVVRSMPNTPAMIGQGITVWAKSSNVSDDQHEVTKTILGSFGKEVFVDNENNLDMATALSGSGPAYFYLVAEAMIDAGVHMGFSRAVATKLVQQTMLGSALYMNQSGKDPVLLRNDITSPGGTTAAALYRAEKNGFRADIGDAIWAAYERCLELAAPYPVQRKRPRS